LKTAENKKAPPIGRDLHDSLGQYLAVLKLKLESVASNLQRKPDLATEDIAACIRLADESIKEVRTVSYLLYPPMLEEMGLKSAIPWYLDGFSSRSGINATFTADEQFRRLSAEAEIAMFRVLQESLTNVHRHSGSRTATIQIYFDETNIRVDVSDQGKGIASERLAEVRAGGSGVGIRGMQERLRQFGGEMRLEATGSGTLVTARLPIPNPVTATDEHCARKGNPESSHSQTPLLVPPASPRPVKPTLQC